MAASIIQCKKHWVKSNQVSSTGISERTTKDLNCYFRSLGPSNSWYCAIRGSCDLIEHTKYHATQVPVNGWLIMWDLGVSWRSEELGLILARISFLQSRPLLCNNNWKKKLARCKWAYSSQCTCNGHRKLTLADFFLELYCCLGQWCDHRDAG